MKCYLLSFIFALATYSVADDIDTYTAFLKRDIWDAKLPNYEINNIVKEGIQHANPQIASLTLRALGELSIQIAWSLPGRDGDVPPVRTFSEVPGLKQYLVDLWDSKFKESGFDTVSVLKEATSLREGENLEDQVRRILGREEHTEISFQDIADATLASIPAWTYAPTILSVYWPNDLSVYKLIWHAHDNESSIPPNMLTLLHLNAGKFNSRKDNEFRLSMIESYADTQPPNLFLLIYAAHGLRFSNPDKALSLLVDTAKNNINSRDRILVLTAEYEDEQLKPYIQKLVRIYQNFNLNYVPKQLLSAHKRILTLAAQ